jgi:hypothetical protein
MRNKSIYMLRELFDLVQGSAKDSVINNPEVPNEQNKEVVAEATNTVASGLRNVVAGGGLENLLTMFASGGQQSGKGLLNNPIVNMMVGHFTEKLMSKHGLGSEQASNVAGNLIPDVLGKLITRTNDPHDNSFSLEKLLGSITGGRSNEIVQQTGGNTGFNLPDLIGTIGGGSQGSGGLMDIVTKMAQGAQGQQQRNGGGGLMDLIKGFIK